MNLRVRRVQEVFDILATTLWVVTAPKQEGRPARGLGLKEPSFLALDSLEQIMGVSA